MKLPSRGLIVAAICVAATSAAGAGTFAAAAAPFAKQSTPQQRDEWRFLKEAAAASRFESEAARMALAKSGDANVRSLAASLVNHHSIAQPALQRMLHVRNMAMPMLSGEQRKSLNQLVRLQGVKFDREWMQAVALSSQQQSLAAYERAAGIVRDPSLRAWIADTLPAMRYQLATAERAMTPGPAKLATLAPTVTRSAMKSAVPPAIATRSMGAVGDASDLGEGNMLLGPARPVAVRLTEPNSR